MSETLKQLMTNKQEDIELMHAKINEQQARIEQLEKQLETEEYSGIDRINTLVKSLNDAKDHIDITLGKLPEYSDMNTLAKMRGM